MEKIAKANCSSNPLSDVSSLVLTAHSKSFGTEYCCGNDLSPVHREMIFTMFASHMKQIYEATWGWNSKKKRKELFSADSKFLLVFDRSEGLEILIAWSMFKFEWDDPEVRDQPVLYCYEIHVSNTHRGCSLGRQVRLD